MRMTLKIPDWVIVEVNNRLERGLENSRCVKRPIAAVLWSHFGFFVNGSNGPPKCFEEYCTPCPRADSGSGEDMDICPAVHGEIDAIVRAAWDGVSTMDGVLFISIGLCKAT